ncbi:FecR family protein [Sphingobacterium thalpophilum]|uniref:FecR protein n=1 Tax=Sphingobacterium thalpophilum TaxID=259 RepID=A0A4U9VN04_9SPHI|nr:FecR family protein [Sphingobacterium thalpophilum]VTR44834.1 FecR protein [Sphingobacterium thalpophilum]
MEEQSFKYQLAQYIRNRLEAQYYEAFFDEMAKIDSVILENWVNEILEEDERRETDIQIPDLYLLHKEVLNNIYSLDPPKSRQPKTIHYWAWASCAAILLCVFAAFYLMHKGDGRHTKSTPSVFWYENTQAYAIDTWLPDSSIAILYPNSRIAFTYEKSGKRAVQQLCGKVIYKVHKNQKAPFQVHYKSWVTTALGTIFSVDPMTDERLLIKLMEGKISVGKERQNASQLVYLRPGEEVLVSLRSRQMLKSSGDDLAQSMGARANKKLRALIPRLSSSVEWTNQSVSFSQTKNIQLLQVIESLYDVSIVCDSPGLLGNSFTGSLNRKEPLEKFLTNFCQLNGCTFNIDNGIIHLSDVNRKEVSK